MSPNHRVFTITMNFLNPKHAHFIMLGFLLLDICTGHSDTQLEQSNRTKRFMEIYPQTGESAFAQKTQYDVGRAKPGSKIELVKYDSAAWNVPHYSFIVYNFGKHPFQATGVYGSHVTSWSPYIGYKYEVDQLKIIPMKGNFFLTELQVDGDKEGTGLVYVYRIGGQPPGYTSHEQPEQFALNIDFLQVVVKLASKSIGKFYPDPLVGIGLSVILEVMFPEEKEDPWKQIEGKVNKKIEEHEANVISIALGSDLRRVKEKIKRLKRSTNTSPRSISRKVMSCINTLVGFESKFQVANPQIDYNRINYHILPLYSQVVNMKLAFYLWCLRYADKLGLEADYIKEIEEERNSVIDRATSYIYNMYTERNTHAYEECETRHIYNCVMDIRTNIAIHGLEYVPYWKALKKDEEELNALPTIVSYSSYFGRASNNHYRQIFIKFGEPPLTPELKDKNTRATLTKIALEFGNNNDIVGVIQTFDTGKVYGMGHKGLKSSTIDLADVRIDKLKVGGDGNVNYIIFYLSDGRELKYGHDFDSGYSATFELSNHYVSSIFIANDVHLPSHQLASISCSFILKPEVATSMQVTSEDAPDQDS